MTNYEAKNVGLPEYKYQLATMHVVQINTHLPTVWLASCLMRLNCFFMFFLCFCFSSSPSSVSPTSL